MQRYKKFSYVASGDYLNIYSTDLEFLDFVKEEFVKKFTIKKVELFLEGGAIRISIKGFQQQSMHEFFIDSLLCFNGWEPYSEPTYTVHRSYWRLKFES